MKTSIRTLSIFALITGALLLATCKKSDEDSTPTITCDGTVTYMANAKAILDKSCTAAGCHNASSGRGDFTTYAGIKPYLTSGDFYKKVITIKIFVHK